jgi:hypothetical protein
MGMSMQNNKIVPLKAVNFFRTPEVENNMRVREDSDRDRLGSAGDWDGGDLDAGSEEEVTASGMFPELRDMEVLAKRAALCFVCIMLDSKFR